MRHSAEQPVPGPEASLGRARGKSRIPVIPVVRRLMLVAAMAALIAGVWAGLLRFGLAWPTLPRLLPMTHGPLMVGGFLGALISLERAVALNRAWTLMNDVRDVARAERLAAVAGDAGCHACHTHGSCTERCPKHLEPTAGIAGLKRLATRAVLKGEA